MYRQYVQSGIAPGANTVTTSAIAANTIQPWQLSSSLLNPTVNSFTGDGTTTSFTLSLPPASANTVVVTVNGITQSPVTNYSTNNTSLVFTSAPSNASVIRAVQQAMIGTSIVPIDGSVTNSKLGSNLTLSGNTSFSGAISGTSATLSSLTASSAVATDASKGLVSVTNTGSGNNVLSASPTLTGTVAAASLSLSSLTSGRVTYAGASGLLSDSASLTYDGTTLTTPRLALGGTTLPSAGTATLFLRSSDNSTYLQTGSGNNIYFLDGSQNTMLSLTPTSLGFQISNANKLTLNSSYLYTASGIKVGIGLSDPASTLTVASTANSIELKQNAAGSATYYVMDNTIETGGKRWRFGYTGAAAIPTFSLYNQTDNVAAWVVNASGKLGIGDTSPNQLLTLGSSDGTQALSFVTSAYLGDNALIGNIEFSTHGADADYGNLVNIKAYKTGTNTNSGDLTFWTKSGGSLGERVRITNAGNVGIGTISPNAKLQVTTSSFPVLKVADELGGGAIALGDAAISSNYVGIWRGAANSISGGGFLNIQGNNIAFMSTDAVFGSATRTMTLDNSGNLLVGTTGFTSAPSPNAGLSAGNFRSLYGSIAVAGGATSTILTLSSSVNGTYIIQANFGAQGNAIYGGMLIVIANAGSFRIVTNGSGSSCALTLSGANVQITNPIGSALDATGSAILISN